MARGKQTCKILKEIRRQIAAANDIEFTTSECRYKGDCLGTCPKCEAEVRYLEEQLLARSLAGKRVMLVGMSAGVLLLAGCGGNATSQQNPIENDAETEMAEVTVGYSSLCEDVEEEEVFPEEAPETETPVTELLIVGGIEDEEFEAAPRTTVDIPEGVGGILDAPVEAKPEPNPDSDEPMEIQFLDSKPVFPGNEDALYAWLKQNQIYPAEAAEEWVQGRVVVEFVVEGDGSISNVKVVRSRHPALDAEAVRLIQSMPRWTPGTYNGDTVRTTYTLPVTFKLQ
ncbi:MAG: energy transducer TonB [Bacteroidales bacterium]|nr:energy transducer TonB [Bacteroidales bacterium]